MNENMELMELEDFEAYEDLEDFEDYEDWELEVLESPPARRRQPGGGAINMPPITIIGNLGWKATVGDYATNAYQLTPAQRGFVSAVAQEIVRRHGTSRQVNRVRIVGHTDDRGTVDYNLGLGYRRAQAVRRYMQQIISAAGVRIMLKTGKTWEPHFEECSAGESRPLPGGSPAKNRRVEIFLLKR